MSVGKIVYSQKPPNSRSLYCTYFIKLEKVNQWHSLEKEITDGNTVSHIKLQMARISKNPSLGLEPSPKQSGVPHKLKLSCPMALWKIKTLPLLNTLKNGTKSTERRQ